jgi:hypothetical protein
MSLISAHGIAVDSPPGTEVRIFRRDPGAGTAAAERATVAAAPGPGETYNAVAHVANFPLPAGMGDFGSVAVEQMGAGHVLVCLLEYDREAAGTPLFAHTGLPRLTAADFSPHTMQRTIAGMSGSQTFFHVGDRAFCLYVVLGSHGARTALVPIANDLIGRVSIS